MRTRRFRRPPRRAPSRGPMSVRGCGELALRVLRPLPLSREGSSVTMRPQPLRMESGGSMRHCVGDKVVRPRGKGELMSQDEKTFNGQCFCGAVTIVVTGDPVGAGYCHCGSCRSWSAGPLNAFTLWKPEAVQGTPGGDPI